MRRKKQMDTVVVGTKRFDGKVDVTDPCYNSGNEGRLDGLDFEPGIYTCYIMKDEDTLWGERVSEIGVTLDRKYLLSKNGFEYEGAIGVDAGIAGFFQNKPDYTDEEWSSFCDKLGSGNAWIFDEGFFSSSGYGDGEYCVYVAKNDAGKIVAAYIDFIGEGDDEEDFLIPDEEEWQDKEEEDDE